MIDTIESLASIRDELESLVQKEELPSDIMFDIIYDLSSYIDELYNIYEDIPNVAEQQKELDLCKEILSETLTPQQKLDYRLTYGSMFDEL